jgi:predicted ATPase
MSALDWTLVLRNFRVIRNFSWSPGTGVCLLAGPNGSGKTTTLDALSFLKALFTRGHEIAFNTVGGEFFRSIHAEEGDPTSFELKAGDVKWRLKFPMSSSGLMGTFGEELWHGQDLILQTKMFEDKWKLGGVPQEFEDSRCCAKLFWDRGTPEWMRPFVNLLSDFRIHKSPWLNQVHERDASNSHTYLHPTGKNLWAVLANWKAAQIRYGKQFDWVMGCMSRAFPDITGVIEFDRGIPIIYGPGSVDVEHGLPSARMADGFLTGLIHLTATAGARSGSTIAFDEVENQLHPHALRSILASMRERAEAQGLTIILTTHSPVVMNTFKGQESKFYVLDKRSSNVVPVALNELHNPDWLEHFSLGDLYEGEQFGAPLG